MKALQHRETLSELAGKEEILGDLQAFSVSPDVVSAFEKLHIAESLKGRAPSISESDFLQANEQIENLTTFAAGLRAHKGKVNEFFAVLGDGAAQEMKEFVSKFRSEGFRIKVSEFNEPIAKIAIRAMTTQKGLGEWNEESRVGLEFLTKVYSAYQSFNQTEKMVSPENEKLVKQLSRRFESFLDMDQIRAVVAEVYHRIEAAPEFAPIRGLTPEQHKPFYSLFSLATVYYHLYKDLRPDGLPSRVDEFAECVDAFANLIPAAVGRKIEREQQALADAASRQAKNFVSTFRESVDGQLLVLSQKIILLPNTESGTQFDIKRSDEEVVLALRKYSQEEIANSILFLKEQKLLDSKVVSEIGKISAGVIQGWCESIEARRSAESEAERSAEQRRRREERIGYNSEKREQKMSAEEQLVAARATAEASRIAELGNAIGLYVASSDPRYAEIMETVKAKDLSPDTLIEWLTDAEIGFNKISANWGVSGFFDQVMSDKPEIFLKADRGANAYLSDYYSKLSRFVDFISATHSPLVPFLIAAHPENFVPSVIDRTIRDFKESGVKGAERVEKVVYQGEKY